MHLVWLITWRFITLTWPPRQRCRSFCLVLDWHGYPPDTFLTRVSKRHGCCTQACRAWTWPCEERRPERYCWDCNWCCPWHRRCVKPPSRVHLCCDPQLIPFAIACIGFNRCFPVEDVPHEREENDSRLLQLLGEGRNHRFGRTRVDWAVLVGRMAPLFAIAVSICRARWWTICLSSTKAVHRMMSFSGVRSP